MKPVSSCYISSLCINILNKTGTLQQGHSSHRPGQKYVEVLHVKILTEVEDEVMSLRWSGSTQLTENTHKHLLLSLTKVLQTGWSFELFWR